MFRSLALSAVFLAVGLPAAALGGDAPPEIPSTVVVSLDQARAFTVPAGARVVSVGNPAIAEVTATGVQNVSLITGKAFGTTNLLMLDANGRVLVEAVINVARNTKGMVTVQHGLGQRSTFACAPTCAPTATLGDSADTFGTVSAQMQQRGTLAGNQ
ncbi:pilus assembly protein N-terminal domain-containing protein [Xanthobacter flavus]|uniref:pilus assembly protein N-terminal domain-containing protein n=1 Tax=Xanthobacter flavus TaxID=281 RepID=UPI00372B3DEF